MTLENDSNGVNCNKFNKDILLSWSALICFVIYVSYLAYLVFFSHEYGRTEIHHSYNLTPFKTIRLYLKLGFNKTTIINLLGNIVSFIPMGILLPIVSTKMVRLKLIIFTSLLVSVIIEVIQYISGAGAGDIDDVLLNMIGGLMGYSLYYLVKQFKNRH